MSIIGWIVFGLIVGVVAKFLTPGPDPGGWILTILLGIGGALLGGFIGRGLGWYREEDSGFSHGPLGGHFDPHNPQENSRAFQGLIRRRREVGVLIGLSGT